MGEVDERDSMAEPINIDGLHTEKGLHTVPLETLEPLQVLELLNAAEQTLAQRVAAQLPIIAQVIETMTPRMMAGGRLIYIGAGTSGRLGVLDAAECPPTFGVDNGTVIGIMAGGDAALRHAVERAEDDWAQGRADLERLKLGVYDCVLGISASGRTPYVLGALQYARDFKALTVALTNNRHSAMGRMSHFAIEVDTGPEVLAGSTRLKSGSAQKMVLNMISTTLMIGLGKTYNNLMVGLRPTNDKLVHRAKRIIAEACDCSFQRAEALFEQAQGDVKVAIVMEREIYPAALHRLTASDGNVRIALQP